MKYVKNFKRFNEDLNFDELNYKEDSIYDILNPITVEGEYTILEDGSVDIYGSLNINGHKDLEELPFKINKISGALQISNCSLKSLKNFPDEIGGSVLRLHGNKLTSLDGLPSKLPKNVILNNNELVDLGQHLNQDSVEYISLSWNKDLSNIYQAFPKDLNFLAINETKIESFANSGLEYVDTLHYNDFFEEIYDLNGFPKVNDLKVTMVFLRKMFEFFNYNSENFEIFCDYNIIKIKGHGKENRLFKESRLMQFLEDHKDSNIYNKDMVDTIIYMFSKRFTKK